MQTQPKILIEGYSIPFLAEEYGIHIQTLYARYKRGARTIDELTREVQMHRLLEEQRREATDTGKRLLDTMGEQRLSVAELSRRARVNPSTIDEILYNPNAKTQVWTMVRICKTLHISMDWLVGL